MESLPTKYPNPVRIPFPNEISKHYGIQACENNPDAGNGRHHYLITATDPNGKVDFVLPLDFQKGPLPQVGHNGILSNVLLTLLIDHLKSFQTGPYANRETACAITNLEQALHWMAARAEEREARGVLGQHTK